MRKNNKIKKLSRTAKQRKALNKALFVGLVENKRIKTTLAKAKSLKPFAERQITIAKRNGEDKLTGIRNLTKKLPKSTAKKVVEISKLYKDVKGGYLRIVKLPHRENDAADMALLEWIKFPEEPKREDKKSKKDSSKKEKGEGKKKKNK